MAQAYLDDSDSDFYGSEEVKSKLHERVRQFDVAKWDETQKAAGRSSHTPERRTLPEQSKLHNPYAGVPYAWQLTETVDDFLERLPPSTTEATEEHPWIFICNPYIQRQSKHEAQNQGSRGNEDEAPEEEGTQLATLMEGGAERLHLLQTFVRGVKATKQAPHVVQRDINKEKREAVDDILHLAHACRVRAGKWMLFCQPHVVDEVWELVAKATARNELGIAAKVAPRADDTGRQERLVCIYTADFRDLPDVVRVLRRLKELHVIEKMGKAIYYKPDAFTYIGIASGNSWELKASLYSSMDVEMKLRQKLG